ncbi:unnamed protein product [Rhizopus stolonifer]
MAQAEEEKYIASTWKVLFYVKYIYLLLFFRAGSRIENIRDCGCQSIINQLMLMGFFPSSPMFPRIAVHLGLIKLCDSMAASGQGMADFYNLLNQNQEKSQLETIY